MKGDILSWDEQFEELGGKFHLWCGRGLTTSTLEELQEIAAGASKIKALGSRHSFNSIADTDGVLISMAGFDWIAPVDAESHTVRMGGGVTYGQLAPKLQEQGYALKNLASLPHISVAGAVATGTHGSGVKNGCLSTSVVSFEIVSPDGSLQSFAKSDPSFEAAVVGLGALGIVSALTLEVVPTFELGQTVYENLAMEDAFEDFEAIVSSAYSVSLFTDWKSLRFNQVWVKHLEEVPAFRWAAPATQKLHPVPGMASLNCTDQLGSRAPWLDRLPHFKMGFTPSNGVELQTEYLIAREDAVAALRALAALQNEIASLLQINEIRTVAADGLWMSPAYGRESVAIHFTWVQDQPAVESLLPKIEAALEPFAARPHWGKLFSMGADRLSQVYPCYEEFVNLVSEKDPSGKLQNAFLRKVASGKL